MKGYHHPWTRMACDLSLDPPTAAYIAAALDGEGTITLTRDRRGRFSPIVTVAAQSNREWLEGLQRDLGGMGRIHVSGTSRAGKVNYALRLGTEEMKVVLREIVPYLRLKKSRAEMLLEFLSWEPEQGVKGAGRSSNPNALALMARIRVLNGGTYRRDGQTCIEKDAKSLLALGLEINKGLLR